MATRIVNRLWTESTSRARAPDLGEVLEFLRLIWALDHALQRRSKRMEATLGVTGPQRLVIRIVGRFPGAPAGLLSQILHIHPSTLTGILKRLQVKGLLRRQRDRRDARRSILTLTDKGHRLDIATKGTIESSVERALFRLSPRAIKAARGVLESLTRALEERM